jgi:hypothetical protein
VRELEKGDDLDGDGAADYERVVGRQFVSVFLDVEFEFEIAGGMGRVRTRPAAAP